MTNNLKGMNKEFRFNSQLRINPIIFSCSLNLSKLGLSAARAQPWRALPTAAEPCPPSLPVRAPAGGPFVPRAAGSTGTELLPASFVGAMSEPAYRL